MSRPVRRWAVAIALLLAVGLLVVAFIVSHDSSCGPAPPLPNNAKLMKGIVYRCYGPPEVLRYEDVEKPTAADNEVLVKVQAASINPLDWHFMRGKPYLVRPMAGLGKPKDPRIGVDFAGTVEAVGKNVKQFKAGDEIFGAADGAFAEYVSVPEDDALALKPANMTFEQTAAIPIAGVTALQGLRDQAHIQPGQRILINGASGGVGTFAVQIAKSFGADVTGVCSTRNVDMVRSIGADHVIDYTREDFTKADQRYDVILDNVANHSLSECRRVLNPDGRYVLIGGGAVNESRWLGPGLTHAFKAMFLSKFVSQKMGMM